MRNLATLNLANNRILDAGAAAFAGAITTSGSLESLNLSCNTIGEVLSQIWCHRALCLTSS